MSYPYGEEYTTYRWLCCQEACTRLLDWQPEPGDFYLRGDDPTAPIAWLAHRDPPAGACLYPRLDQLKTRAQRRLVTSWRRVADHFDRWMAEHGFFETEEEAWLRFLAHLVEADLPEPG